MGSYGAEGCRQVALGFRVATLNLNQLDAELEQGKGIFLLRGEHRNFSGVQGASWGSFWGEVNLGKIFFVFPF